MSVFFRRREERRDLSSLPWIAGGDRRTHVDQSRALSLAPVFAANRHLCDLIAPLPLKAYRKNGEERQPMPNLPKLFGDLETAGELVPWLTQAVSSLVLRGNAVGLKVATDGFGFPTIVQWLDMDRVYVDDSSGTGRWYIDGRSVSRLDLVWIPWLTIPGRTLGLSPIEHFALTITAGLDAQSYGGDWFRGGGFPPAVFKNVKKEVPAEAAAGIRDRVRRSIRKREPLVHGVDWEYTPITIPPEQAQFIETQKLSATHIAGIYGIAPDEIGGENPNSLTYQNEEHRQTVRAHNARPYMARLERVFASILPDRQFVRFLVDGMLRSDAKTRAEIRESDDRIGFRTINEMRAVEDLPPIEGGDTVVPRQTRESTPEAQRHLSVINQEGSA